MSIRLANHVWEHAQLSGTDLLMLLALADHANDEAVCWPSLERLAARCRISKRQAQRVIQRLIAAGEIYVDAGNGRGNTSYYHLLNLPEKVTSGAEKVTSASPIAPEEKVTSSAEKVTPEAEKVTSSALKGDIAMSPEPLEPLEPSENREGVRATTPAAIPEPTPPAAVSEEIDIWAAGAVGLDRDWTAEEFDDYCAANAVYAAPAAPQEPDDSTSIPFLPEPPADEPRAPRRIRSGVPGAKSVRITSPYLAGAPVNADGYIPAGMGENAIQVYYERFKITQNDARLSAPQEDDLVRLCPDLPRLRDVVAAYERSGYRLGNVQLILDWYRSGIPTKGNNHATHRSSSFGRAAFPSLAAQSPSQPEPEYNPFAGLTDAEVERIRGQVSRARGYGVPVPAA